MTSYAEKWAEEQLDSEDYKKILEEDKGRFTEHIVLGKEISKIRKMTKQELEYRIEELEKEIDHLENENHWLEIKNGEVEELEGSLKTLRLEIEDLKEKYLPQNLMEEQIFEIFYANKDRFTIEQFERIFK